MNVKKIAVLAVTGLVLYCLIVKPEESANAVRVALNGLGDGASSIITFAQALLS